MLAPAAQYLKKKKGMIQRLSWSLCKEIFVSFNAFNENA
jgi:hypothetical protein